jgi:hypothetical protein
MGERSSYGEVRMVTLKGTDVGVPVQELLALEEAAENAVGRGVASDRKGEELLHDPGFVCGYGVHPVDLGFPPLHRGGEADRSERR